jgi:hypothetical protein
LLSGSVGNIYGLFASEFRNRARPGDISNAFKGETIEHLIKELSRMNTVPRVFAYLRRYPWLALGTLCCAIVGTAMVLVFPAVTKRVVDEVLIQPASGRLAP